MPRRLAIALLAIVMPTALGSTTSAAEPAVNFARDVKPILARRCFSCHGPNKHEGGLRLDDPQAALAQLDSGLHAIVPGSLDNSALIARVTAEDESERMPPEGKPLAPNE